MKEIWGVKKYFIVITAIAMFIVLGIFISQKAIKPSVNEKTISVEGFLKLNITDNNNHKEYLLNINIIKNKDSNIAIYPYLNGLGHMSFSEEDIKDYYVPDSVGSDGFTAPVAMNILKNSKIIERGDDVSLIGFWLPYEAGQYSTRVYLDKLDTFEKIKNPVLVCVYTEKKYGQKLGWSKVVPIKIK